MFRLIHLFQTAIGSKQVMATSGLLLVAFLLVHMLGNLTVYQGPEAINAYADWLQGHPLLWAVRIVLLAVVVAHIAVGIRLARENRAARPQRYQYRNSVQVKFAARTMVISGILVLTFLAYHLAHFTGGLVGPGLQHDVSGRLHVYANIVASFSNPWIAWGYVIAMVLLGLHLSHAIQSLFQTLGLKHENWEGFINLFSPALALVIVLGFISIPLAVQFGVLTLPAGGAA